jgi:hypothetical protein
MTNEELDEVRAEEAWNIIKGQEDQDVALIAARLAREGWTPPVAVDPDLAEAKYLAQTARAERLTSNAGIYDLDRLALAGIKRGRELERQEAQPGMVWVKHDGSEVCPLPPRERILILDRFGSDPASDFAEHWRWNRVTHYAIITQPEEK